MSLAFGRAYKAYYSILKLSEIAYTEDAGIILRSLFNLLVIVRWISVENSEERARKYIGWYWIALKELFTQHLATGIHVDPLTTQRILDEYENHRKLFEYKDKKGKHRIAKKWHEPDAANISDMAAQVDLKAHYDGLYRPLSRLEHSESMAYFAVASGARDADGVTHLRLDSDLFVAPYLRNAFQYFGEILRVWIRTFRSADEENVRQIMAAGMKFFSGEGERPAH